MSISNLHPTSSQQPQLLSQLQPPTNPNHIRISENADQDIEDAPDDAETNEEWCDDDDDCED
jgi:hypothetical protein